MPSICQGGNSREENKLSWGHTEGAGDGDPHHDFQQMLVFLSDLPLGCDLPLPPHPSLLGWSDPGHWSRTPLGSQHPGLPLTVTLDPGAQAQMSVLAKGKHISSQNKSNSSTFQTE